jgi:hypothetical protein
MTYSTALNLVIFGFLPNFYIQPVYTFYSQHVHLVFLGIFYYVMVVFIGCLPVIIANKNMPLFISALRQLWFLGAYVGKYKFRLTFAIK